MAQATEREKAKCSTAAFPKLFTFREIDNRFLLLKCHALPENYCSTSCLPLDIKDLMKEDMRVF
jgi:hypothetical protein